MTVHAKELIAMVLVTMIIVVDTPYVPVPTCFTFAPVGGYVVEIQLVFCLSWSLSLVPDGSDGDAGYGADNVALKIGVLYVILGVITIPICGFVLSVISRPPLIKHSCYKLMAFTTILDILNLIHGAIVPGLFSLLRIHHCRSGKWVVYGSQYMMAVWYVYCCANEVLALNRMLEFASGYTSKLLFFGKRVYLWMGVALCYGIICTLLVSDAFYFYNPYGGYYEAKRLNGEPNIVHIFNNMFKFGFVTTAYIIMLALIYRRLRSAGRVRVSKFQVKVSIQTLAIAGLSDLVTMAYMAIGYAPLSPEFAMYTGLLGQLSWIALHGGTGIIYMVMNSAVNQKFKKLFCRVPQIATSHGMHSSAAYTVPIALTRFPPSHTP
uniref:G protein-coupled receptor n=1 Tax=Steinernema glaseri TaxID=37863 RepID=A0A1I7Y1A5_9BILA